MESYEEIQALLSEDGWTVKTLLCAYDRKSISLSTEHDRLRSLQASVWGVTRIMSNKCRYRKPLVEALEQSETGIVKED